MTRPGRRAVLAVAVAASAAACSGDRREAERAVRDYNDAAVLAYRTRDFSRLREVATEKEWGKVVVLVDLKTADGLVLESELLSLEVTRIARPSPDRLQVGTRERWRYHDRPVQPGRSPGPVFVADTALTYDFVRQGGAWKLDSARTLSNELLEPEELRARPVRDDPERRGDGAR